MTLWNWLTIVGIAALFGFVWLIGRIEARNRRKAARRVMDLQKMRAGRTASSQSAAFGPGISPQIVSRVLRIVAEVSEYSILPERTSVDPALLEADDRLTEDLGYCMDSLSGVELGTRLEKEFGLRKERLRLTPPVTVKSIVLAVARGLDQKRGGAAPGQSQEEAVYAL